MKKIAVASVSLVVIGCANIDGQPVEDSVQVYKQTGSTQCADDGLTVAELTQQLNRAQVRVLETACGTDGLMRTTVCGAPDGSIVVFEIPQGERAIAAQAGFEPLNTLPQAQIRGCPAT